MDELFNTIRTAIAPNASNEARAAGAAACRTIIGALEAKAGEPIASVGSPQLVAAMAALRTIPSDKLLDMAIAKVRSMLPPDANAPPVQSLNIPLVPLPKLGGAP